MVFLDVFFWGVSGEKSTWATSHLSLDEVKLQPAFRQRLLRLPATLLGTPHGLAMELGGWPGKTMGKTMENDGKC